MTTTRVDLTGSDADLIAAYAECAMAYGAASDRSDPRPANRQYDVGAAIVKELRNRGAIDKLRILLGHENPWVRCWSATEALRFAPKEGERVLSALMKDRPTPIIAINARVILEANRKGELNWGDDDLSSSPKAEPGETDAPEARPRETTRLDLHRIPREVSWSEVTERDRFDERFGDVNVLEGAIMDIGDDTVVLTTDDDEPTHDQLVAWTWLIRPDLRSQLREVANEAMRATIDDYDEGP